jgi:hypothetical protein
MLEYSSIVSPTNDVTFENPGAWLGVPEDNVVENRTVGILKETSTKRNKRPKCYFIALAKKRRCSLVHSRAAATNVIFSTGHNHEEINCTQHNRSLEMEWETEWIAQLQKTRCCLSNKIALIHPS